MQALASYADDSDSSPPPPAAGPSRPRDYSPSELSSSSLQLTPANTRKRSRSAGRSPSAPRRPPSTDPSSYPPSSRQSPYKDENGDGATPSKRPRSRSPRTDSRAPSRRASSNSSDDEEDEFPGMTDDEIFRQVTRPPGDEDQWGVPPAADPTTCDPRLEAKVAQFLRLKRQGQHINTSLLQSSSFANPHIYSKLVEFVAIDERATAFPGGGWLTRRNLEGEVARYGPKALSATQTAMAEAAKRAQEGKRREIAFTSSSRSGGRDRDRDDRRRRDRDRDADRDRRERAGLSRPRHGWEGAGRRERDRR